MGWAILFSLVLIVTGVLWRFGRLSQPALQLTLAAMCVGIAGYVLQGRPYLEGRPSAAVEPQKQADSAFSGDRPYLFGRFGGSAQILDAADAMHRQGMDDYAIALIKGGLKHKPKDVDLLVGLGNELILYANGMITPAALLAFEQASRASPAHPGPPYFLGLAYAQAGNYDAAELFWVSLWMRTPPGAPWRSLLETRLRELKAAKTSDVH